MTLVTEKLGVATEYRSKPRSVSKIVRYEATALGYAKSKWKELPNVAGQCL